MPKKIKEGVFYSMENLNYTKFDKRMILWAQVIKGKDNQDVFVTEYIADYISCTYFRAYNSFTHWMLLPKIDL